MINNGNVKNNENEIGGMVGGMVGEFLGGPVLGAIGQTLGSFFNGRKIVKLHREPILGKKVTYVD